MRNRLVYGASALLLIAAVILAGCRKAGGTPQPTVAPERPQVTAAPDKVAPPEVSNYAGYSISLKPARGTAVIMREPAAAQLIMDAFASDRLRVNEPGGKFNNRLEVLDPEGKPRYAFTIASDGRMLMKYAGDGRMFRMPEYIYCLLEETLWSYNGSLTDTWVKWQQPDKGTAMLELELPRLLKCALLPAYGYALAYFTTYKIYGVNTSVRNTVRVYLLVTYAGYDIQGTSFEPNFIATTPVTLTFKKAGGDYWQLTELKRPPQTKLAKDLYANVRTIFPFEHMESVLEDLKNTDVQVTDIVKQATEYLQEMGISGLTVQS